MMSTTNEPKQRFNPLTFLRQVRTETAQVIWPSRNETVVTTIMVVILAVIASLFFFVADQILNWLLSFVLELRN